MFLKKSTFALSSDLCDIFIYVTYVQEPPSLVNQDTCYHYIIRQKTTLSNSKKKLLKSLGQRTGPGRGTQSSAVFINLQQLQDELTWTEAQISDKTWVTGTKPVAELSDEGFQILSSLLWGMDVSEEISQRIGEELVTEIMKCNQLIQDIPPAHTYTFTNTN